MTEREDKRMDDLVAQVNHGFARVADESSALRREIHGLRVELKDEIQDVRGEIQGLRVELKEEIQGVRGELKGEIHGLRVELKDEMNLGFERIDRRFDRMHHWAVAIVVAMLGLIGANVLQTLGG